jgi:hypothetical protein
MVAKVSVDVNYEQKIAVVVVVIVLLVLVVTSFVLIIGCLVDLLGWIWLVSSFSV